MSITPRALFERYNRHLDALILPFQAILPNHKTLEKLQNGYYLRNYCFELFLNLSLVVDTLIQYRIHGFDIHNLRFFHNIAMQFMPESFIIRGNTMHTTIYILIVLCNFRLLFDSLPHRKFVMFFARKHPGSQSTSSMHLTSMFEDAEGSRSDRKLKQRLVQFYSAYQKRVKFFVSQMAFQLNLAFTFPLIGTEVLHMWASDWSYFPSFRVLVCILILPFHLRSYVSVVHIGVQFMCQNYMIQIKQEYYLRKLRIAGSVLKFQKGYFDCLRTMTKLLNLSREIEAFNSFYRPYISLTIVLFIFGGVSVLNAVITKYCEAPILQLIPWVFYAILLLSFIFLFNAASSKTIFLNIKLFKNLRQFQIRLVSRRFYNSTCSQIIKLDRINEYKLLLSKSSFRLANSSSINNKLFFFQIFGYVSLFYMKLVTDENAEELDEIDDLQW